MSKLFTVEFDCGHKLYLTEEEVMLYPIGAEFENGDSCSECDTHKSIVVDTTYVGIERPGSNVVDLTARRSEAAAQAAMEDKPLVPRSGSMYCIIVQRPNNATPLVSPVKDGVSIVRAKEAIVEMAASMVRTQTVRSRETASWEFDSSSEHIVHVYHDTTKVTTLTIGRIVNTP